VRGLRGKREAGRAAKCSDVQGMFAIPGLPLLLGFYLISLISNVFLPSWDSRSGIHFTELSLLCDGVQVQDSEAMFSAFDVSCTRECVALLICAAGVFFQGAPGFLHCSSSKTMASASATPHFQVGTTWNSCTGFDLLKSSTLTHTNQPPSADFTESLAKRWVSEIRGLDWKCSPFWTKFI
jgi:hypothetical protein